MNAAGVAAIALPLDRDDQQEKDRDPARPDEETLAHDLLVTSPAGAVHAERFGE